MPANSSAPKYLKMRFIIVLSKIAYKGTTKKRYMQTQSVKKSFCDNFYTFSQLGSAEKSYKSLIKVLFGSYRILASMLRG